MISDELVDFFTLETCGSYTLAAREHSGGDGAPETVRRPVTNQTRLTFVSLMPSLASATARSS